MILLQPAADVHTKTIVIENLRISLKMIEHGFPKLIGHAYGFPKFIIRIFILLV